MAARAAAAGDDSFRIDAEFGRVLFKPANRALGVGDANAFPGLTSGQLRGFVFAKHLILRRGADEAAAGKVSTGDAELRQRATTPAAPVEENHAGHLCLPDRDWAGSRFPSSRLAGRFFVGVFLARRCFGRCIFGRLFLCKGQGLHRDEQ